MSNISAFRSVIKEIVRIIIDNPWMIFRRWLYWYIKFKYRYPLAKVFYPGSLHQTVVGKYTTLYRNVNISNSKIGSYTYIASGSSIHHTQIGKYCSIGADVKCGLGEHPSHTFVSTHPMFFSTSRQAQVTYADRAYFQESLPINIGNDVWIGANAIILDGVTIADGAIIAAGAVITKDVPPYAIVGGVPAKVIKYRFHPTEISFLLQFCWWDKDEQWIKSNWKLMHNISQLIEFSKATETQK